jgi:lipoyl(octanoyl) transferase
MAIKSMSKSEAPLSDFPDSSTRGLARRVVAEPARARLHAWGLRDFGEILALQEKLRAARREGLIPDTWLAGEHPTVITQGVRGSAADLLATPAWPVFKIDRGGQTTIHTPGQLVIYPIILTHPGLLSQARLSRALLAATRDWIAEQTGVALEIHKGRPGLFSKDGQKAAAIGLSIRGGVSMHGIAINLCNELASWRAIIPCGEPETQPVTLSELAGRRIAPDELISHLPDWLRDTWGYNKVKISKYSTIDIPFAKYVENTLLEWGSDADEEAYRNL